MQVTFDYFNIVYKCISVEQIKLTFGNKLVNKEYTLEEIDAQIDTDNREADVIFRVLLKEHREQFGGIAYALWIQIAHYLVQVGWQQDELLRDAMRHTTKNSYNALDSNN